MYTKLRTLMPALMLGAMSVLLVGCGGATFLDRLGSPWGYGFCGIVILILDIIALLEVWGSSRSTGDKVLWSLLIFFFPVGGLILYYLFGRK